MTEEYFDYQEIEEQPEELDSGHMVECPHCKRPIPHDALLCYYCGNKITKASLPKWVVILIAIIVISFLVLLI